MVLDVPVLCAADPREVRRVRRVVAEAPPAVLDHGPPDVGQHELPGSWGDNDGPAAVPGPHLQDRLVLPEVGYEESPCEALLPPLIGHAGRRAPAPPRPPAPPPRAPPPAPPPPRPGRGGVARGRGGGGGGGGGGGPEA